MTNQFNNSKEKKKFIYNNHDFNENYHKSEWSSMNPQKAQRLVEKIYYELLTNLSGQ